MATDKPLTSQRTLRSHQPLWSVSQRIRVKTEPHPSKREYDVIIVGAGISGALMSLALKPRGMDVLVIDRREPVRGSSMASTGDVPR